ncbi:hypothetical protein CLU79DRAFT_739319 [Phycomyces nitens]|nr:hypothetical protein CLU79DRAFT_739319 [Phycomyces nitens]
MCLQKYQAISSQDITPAIDPIPSLPRSIGLLRFSTKHMYSQGDNSSVEYLLDQCGYNYIDQLFDQSGLNKGSYHVIPNTPSAFNYLASNTPLLEPIGFNTNYISSYDSTPILSPKVSNDLSVYNQPHTWSLSNVYEKAIDESVQFSDLFPEVPTFPQQSQDPNGYYNTSKYYPFFNPYSEFTACPLEQPLMLQSNHTEPPVPYNYIPDQNEHDPTDLNVSKPVFPYNYTCIGGAVDRQSSPSRVTRYDSKKKKFVCDSCGYRTDRHSNLSRHKKSHEPKGRNMKCDHCLKYYANKFNLTRHTKASHAVNRRE